MKNLYKVKKVIDGEIKKHSEHENFMYADIQRWLLERHGYACWVEYRGRKVDRDVKRIIKKGEGI